MAFDREKRTRIAERIRREQIQAEASLSPTERLQMAEELLALAWSMHGAPRQEDWSALRARRAKRVR